MCWDHDRFSKEDYLGEFNVNLKHHFYAHPASQSTAEPRWFTLNSQRRGRKSSVVSGSVELKFWLESEVGARASEQELQSAWAEFTLELESHEDAMFTLAPPERPVGMQMADEDYLSTEDLATVPTGVGDEESDGDTVLGGDSDLDDISESDLLQSSGSSPPTTTDGKLSRKERKKLRKLKKQKPFHFKSANSKDVLGVVFLEIDSASDLPREKNMTKTGYDMDPFVITSFSKKTFRTRVVRHSLNPVFHDKLVLQVHRHENQYNLKFTVVDRDKLSGNDYVGECDLAVQDLIKFGPQANPANGLYALSSEPPTATSTPVSRKNLLVRRLTRQNTDSSFSGSRNSTPPQGKVADASIDQLAQAVEKLDSSASDGPAEMLDSMRLFTLPINLGRKEVWGDKFKPLLRVKAKFIPYPALRQQFWRAILRHYDVEETGDISRVELTTMLDSLGATVKDSTIDSFFQRFSSTRLEGLDSQVDEDAAATSMLDQTLTLDQCVICLEDHLTRITRGSPLREPYSRSTSTRSVAGGRGTPSRPPSRASMTTSSSSLFGTGGLTTMPSNTLVGECTSNQDVISKNLSENRPADNGVHEDNDGEGAATEYLISLTHCPLCQKSNMDKRSAVDIVTHLATCASQDWRKVDHLVMGDFVTPSQAQRKWYTKVISKVGYGGYKLGANSANILVQDRRTGQVQEERMSVYVRLGIRMLYKGMKSSRMETGRIKKMLKSMSIKQGRKYDSPQSAKDIQSFIAFHQLNMAEVANPVSSFKSFNEFFYRKLKPGARPCAQPHDERFAVSPADCRSVVFDTITDAMDIWIKGQNFSLSRLFGEAYPDQVGRFEGGALGIFRLAPQDYHRFHVPVSGVLGTPKTIEGQYYTVNPMAIRSHLDVYGENVRVLVPIASEAFGHVMVVCVGAMMVGSTVITAKDGARVERTDELGYFKFGGSTIILVFEPGRLVFDEDLTQNAKLSIETLLRVGSSIGHPPGLADAPNESAEETGTGDEADAARKIAGQEASDGQSRATTIKEKFSTHNAM